MKIYHGTSVAAARRMVTEGIKPRSPRARSRWTDAPSILGHVYLTTLFGPFFSIGACPARGPLRICLIELDLRDLDSHRLYPDEDFLEHAARVGYRAPPDYLDRLARYRDQIEDYRSEENARLSLEKFGTLSYRGTIAPALIKAVHVAEICPANVNVFCAALDAPPNFYNATHNAAELRGLTEGITSGQIAQARSYAPQSFPKRLILKKRTAFK